MEQMTFDGFDGFDWSDGENLKEGHEESRIDGSDGK